MMDYWVRLRVAMLLDEMLKRGVPMELLKPIIEWLDRK